MKSFSAVSSLLILAAGACGSASAQVAGHGYAEVLVRPVSPAASVAAAAPAPTPAIAAAQLVGPVAAPAPLAAQFKLSDELKLALDAARLDADSKRAVIESQRARGAIDQEQFNAQMVEYQAAVQAYDQLAGPSTEVSSDEQAEQLKSRLWGFNNSGNFRSVLAQVSVRRGSDGSVLAERASLESEVTKTIGDLRGKLPPDQDTRPMQAYLDSLQDKTLANIRAYEQTSDAIPLPDAVGMIQPVQQTQGLMMAIGSSDLNIKLNLNTNPDKAVVVLFTQSGYHRNYLTHSTPIIMRGLLEYVVFKPGFKTVTGTDLDLVNAIKGEFTCQLVAVGAPGPSGPCNVE